MNLDLFAGPGGWEARARDLDLLGVERDEAACATRQAASLPTLQADVAKLDPTQFGSVDLLVASPPCQTFSKAGVRNGVQNFRALHEHIHACTFEWTKPDIGGDPRAALVLEPLRYAIALVPRWIVLEQVPAVLPLWESMAVTLRALGWNCTTTIVNAANYGVPQARRRAVLLADRRGHLGLPEPSHSESGEDDLLSSKQPWVTMADALGWAPGDPRARGRTWPWERPAPTVCGDPRLPDPGKNEAVPGERGFQFAPDAIRLSVDDALTLQSFPASYPVQGTKSKQFEQVGNAVPPLLGECVLRQVAA